MGLSRREFSRLGAMGLAARMVPAVGAAARDGERKVGYCVIGLGRIADHFLRGVQASSNSKITGLVSGHRDKAERIAAQYGVPKSSIYSYEDMDRFRDNKTIDAVYVALPNSMHAEYTIRSAKAGKHVLCEKPISTTVSEAEAMIAACKAANVKLMIAYRLHYEPLNLKAVKLIRDGALGKVQTINGAFGFNANPTAWRFKTIEENVSWTTKFPSGIVATGSSTYGTQMPGYFKVFGSKGWLEMNPAFNYDGLKLRASFSSGERGSP